MIRRIRVPVALVVGAALVAGACSSASGATETLVLGGVEFTEPEFLYGLDVDPDPSVELAPDVVVIPNGSRAVRGVTGDGLTWTLDPNARGIRDLQVGAVMFLTARGVGRVVAIDDDPDSSNLLVTIAPVADITEVIWEGEFGGEGLALDVEQMIEYSTGEQPWSLGELPPTEMPEDAPSEDEVDGSAGAMAPRSPVLGPRRSFPMVDRDEDDETEEPRGGGGGDIGDGSGDGDSGDSGGSGGGGSGGGSGGGGPAPAPGAGPGPDLERHERIEPPRPSWGGATVATVNDYRLTPHCCARGVGVSADYDKNGLRLHARLMFTGRRPTASWTLKISGGRIERATFQIEGGAGVLYEVRASSTTGIPSNVNHRLMLPGTLSLPAVALGVPFTLTVRQELLVRTAFSAKDSSVSASGVWSFQGGFGFGYQNGGFGFFRPSAPEVQRSLLQSIEGTSVGVTGLVLGHRVELKAGIGWEVFNVGPYTELITSMGIVRGSDLAAPLVICRQANLNMWLGAGIGYRLPQVVVEVTNFFLRIVGARTIVSEGSIAGVREHIVQKHGFMPDSRACDNRAA